MIKIDIISKMKEMNTVFRGGNGQFEMIKMDKVFWGGEIISSYSAFLGLICLARVQTAFLLLMADP